MSQKFGSSMGYILINQMQIISLILSNIKWHSDIPQWLIKILVFLGDIFSINLSGLLSSPDCFASMDPLRKWLFALALPWCLAGLFLLWYGIARFYFTKTNEYDENVVETILQSAVQVLLIGLYTTVVKTCFEIFDCSASTPETPSLLSMDPSYLCSEIIVYQAVGAFAFFLWAVLPFLIIGIQLNRLVDKGTLLFRIEDSSRFRVLYGWAINKYKLGEVYQYFQLQVPQDYIPRKNLTVKCQKGPDFKVMGMEEGIELEQFLCNLTPGSTFEVVRILEKRSITYLWEAINATIKILMAAGSVMLYAEAGKA